MNPGDVVTWQNVDNNTGVILQQGQVTVDADGLLTLNNVSIATGTGSRLILVAEPSRPPSPPPATEPPPVIEPPVVEPPADVEPNQPPVDETMPAPENLQPPVDNPDPGPQPEDELNTPPEELITDDAPPSDDSPEPPFADITNDFGVAAESGVVDGNGDSGPDSEDSLDTPLEENITDDAPPTEDSPEPPFADITNEFGVAAESGVADGNVDAVSQPISIAAVRLEATADTMLTSTENTAANLGGADTLGFFAADGGQRTALLNFDTSSLPNTDVFAATLQLTQLAQLYDDSPIEISIYAVAAPWEEGNGTDNWADANEGATWQSEGGGNLVTDFDFGNGPNGLVTTIKLDGFDPNNDTASFDVAAVVQASLSGKLENHGLALVVTGGEYSEYVFASSEAADAANRPALQVSLWPGPFPEPYPQPLSQLASTDVATQIADGTNGLGTDAVGNDAVIPLAGEILDATSRGADGADAFETNAFGTDGDDDQAGNGFNGQQESLAARMSSESSTNFVFPSANAFQQITQRWS